MSLGKLFKETVGQLREVLTYKEMLTASVKKDLQARYRGSVLGFLWTLLNPLMQLAIYSIVFPFLLRMQEPNYPLFVFVGLLPWLWFTSSLATSTIIIVGNGSLVKKIYFPRMILPLATVTTGGINCLLGMVVAIGAVVVSGVPLTPWALLLPVPVILQFIFTAGLCLLLSSLYVYFRDLEHIVGILMQVWFYLTPIVYNIRILPEFFGKLLALNPMTQLVDCYRAILIYGSAPNWKGTGVLGAIGVVVFIVGAMVFTKVQRHFAEEL